MPRDLDGPLVCLVIDRGGGASLLSLNLNRNCGRDLPQHCLGHAVLKQAILELTEPFGLIGAIGGSDLRRGGGWGGGGVTTGATLAGDRPACSVGRETGGFEGVLPPAGAEACARPSTVWAS